MTSICAIVPKHDMFAAVEGDMVFLQADWCSSLYGRTLDAFQALRKNKYLIIDNQHPIQDHTSIAIASASALMDVALRLHANEIIIPDLLNDRLGTLRSADEFFMQYNSPFSHMFVPQGVDYNDWLICLHGVTNSDWANKIHTIGVPKWLGELRWEALQNIPDIYEVHFLGVKTGWGELEYSSRIRSWDTSLMYAAAQYNKYFQDIPRHWKQDLRDDTAADLNLFARNVRYARALLREERVRDDS